MGNSDEFWSFIFLFISNRYFNDTQSKWLYTGCDWKIATYAKELGLSAVKSNKGNLIVTFEGLDSTKVLGLSAHVDTLGLMVRSISADGTLRLTSIGGNQMMTLLGEYCTVHTRDGKAYTGTILSLAPASHVYEDCGKKGKQSMS